MDNKTAVLEPGQSAKIPSSPLEETPDAGKEPNNSQPGSQPEKQPKKQDDNRSFLSKSWDFLREKFNKSNAWGSTAVGVQVAFSRRLEITQGFARPNIDRSKLTPEEIAAGTVPGKDWSRIVGGALGGVNDTMFFISNREGNVPEGKTAIARIGNAMLHPMKYPHHARAVFWMFTGAIKAAGGIYYGTRGLETEKSRLSQALLSISLVSLQVRSLFKAAIKRPQGKLGEETEPAHGLSKTRVAYDRILGKMEASRIAPVQWMGFGIRHQLGLLVAAVIELSIKGLEFYEGVRKKMPGPKQNIAEGSKATTRSLINAGLVASNFGYTVSQLKKKADADKQNPKTPDAPNEAEPDASWISRSGKSPAPQHVAPAQETAWRERHHQNQDKQRELTGESYT